MKSDSALAVAVNVFTSPAEAFAAIRERPQFLFPLLLVIIATVATSTAYMNGVDIAWFAEQQIRAMDFVQLSEPEIAEAVDAAVDRGRTPMLLQASIGTALVIPIVFLLQALYLKLVSLVSRDGVSYRRWFSLVCWTALPVILDQLASLVFILSNNVAFIAQGEVNPLSFGNLLGIEPGEGEAVKQLALALSPVNFWPIILGIAGVKFLSGKSLYYASAVVLAPLVLIVAATLSLL